MCACKMQGIKQFKETDVKCQLGSECCEIGKLYIDSVQYSRITQSQSAAALLLAEEPPGSQDSQ